MKSISQIPNDIAAVKTQFVQWRKTRRHKCERIPDFLWMEAGTLLKAHRASAICRVLKINQAELKRRWEKCKPALHVTRLEVSAPMVSASMAMVKRPDGLTLEIPESMAVDKIGALIAAFCRGREL